MSHDLDPGRVADAAARVDALLAEAHERDREAAALRARAAALARSWNLPAAALDNRQRREVG